MYKVSIVVPIFGVEKYIERCARSLFEQTYDKIEFIFVNDCTNDSSIVILHKVIKDYPIRHRDIKVISHESNRGLAAARNTGVSNCSGDYLLHVDSDDWLELNAVETLVNSIRGNDVDMVCFGYISEYGINSCMSQVEGDRRSLIHGILTNKQHASIWSKMYKSEFYKNSGFDSVEGLNQGEDYVLVPRLLHKASNIIFMSCHLYHYEMTNQNSYTKNVKLSAIKNIHDADNILYSYFSQVSDSALYKNALDILYVRSMLYLIKTSNWSNYPDILAVYREDISRNLTSLSVVDKLILLCVYLGFYKLTFYLIRLGIKLTNQ